MECNLISRVLHFRTIDLLRNFFEFNEVLKKKGEKSCTTCR